MGMDINMLACVRALAENRIQDAKKYAFCCCANDNTKKNESQVRRYKNLLLNGPNMIELPANLNGLMRMEDVSGFHAERYYLGKTQGDLFEKIKRVFDFCKGQKCVLMLDEIDCIGIKRGMGGNGGSDGEISRTTISLMQTGQLRFA